MRIIGSHNWVLHSQPPTHSVPTRLNVSRHATKVQLHTDGGLASSLHPTRDTLLRATSASQPGTSDLKCSSADTAEQGRWHTMVKT
jgi:hypothetical protein